MIDRDFANTEHIHTRHCEAQPKQSITYVRTDWIAASLRASQSQAMDCLRGTLTKERPKP
jgi:hypothetical protein